MTGTPITAPGLTVTIVKGDPSARTPHRRTTRRLHCLHTVHPQQSGVRYAVAGLGIVWLSPYEHDHAAEGIVQVRYGDDDSGQVSGVASPTAPTLNGITLTGTSLIDPGARTSHWSAWYHASRAGHGSVPSATRHQMSQVISQLIDHYLALPERTALDAAVRRRRIQRKIDTVTEAITDLESRSTQTGEAIASQRRKLTELHALLRGDREPS